MILVSGCYIFLSSCKAVPFKTMLGGGLLAFCERFGSRFPQSVGWATPQWTRRPQHQSSQGGQWAANTDPGRPSSESCPGAGRHCSVWWIWSELNMSGDGWAALSGPGGGWGGGGSCSGWDYYLERLTWRETERHWWVWHFPLYSKTIHIQMWLTDQGRNVCECERGCLCVNQLFPSSFPCL